MKKTSLFLVLMFVLSSNNVFSQDYLSNLVSALNKSHSAEAMAALGVYKSNLLACLMNNSGSESSCVSSVNFIPSTNFNYSFSIPPKNGAQVWAIKASGKGNYSPEDAVILVSDEYGVIKCSSSGKMANSC